MQIHLCQPDMRKSCAACCGLYNYVANSREALTMRLEYRTGLFDRVRKGDMDIRVYQDTIRHREDGRRIYKTIYACEFVGFLDHGHKKVGCMLHPMMNSGRDLREISFYGRDICEGHLCPSYDKILDNEARIVVDVIDDWYLYGIVITDIDFIKTFFFLVQNRLGESIDPGRVSPNPGARAAMMRYFNLKIRWPFRDTLRPRFGKYFFLGEEYDIDRIDYESLGASPSVYDPVFLSLSSVFNTRKELTEAEDMVNSIMDDFIYEYTRVDNPHH